MSARQHYVLHVLHAQDLVWEPKLHRKEPHLYVKVKVGDDKRQTRTIKKDLSPSWNEPLAFFSTDASCTVNIQVKHKAAFSSDPCVGYATIELSDLVKACEGGEGDKRTGTALHTGGADSVLLLAALDLLSPHKKSNGTTAGTIFLQLKSVDLMSGVGIEVEALPQTVQSSGIGHSGYSATFDKCGRLTDGNELYKALGGLLSKLQPIASVIDDVSRVHPYVSAAWQLASILHKSVANQFQIDEKVMNLARALEETFDFVRDTQTLRNKTRVLEPHIIKLLQTTSECCQFLQEYLRHGFAGRMLNLSAGEEVGTFIQSLSDQKNGLHAGLALHNAITAARISGKIDALFLQQRLNIHTAAAVSRQTCLEDTRVETRPNIIDLLKAETGPNIIWLHGVAGSGKSTIATTIEDYFRDTSQLGAFLLFERGKSEPSSVIRDIAFKLALFDSSIGSCITEHVDQDKDIASALLSRQFEKLLLQPLSAAASSASGSTNAQEPVVIVLDALDECGTPRTRADLIRLLKHEFPKLPPTFRFLITSRPESDLVWALSLRPESVHEIELDYTSDASRQDVLSYLHHEIREIVTANPQVQIPKDWSWNDNMALLGKAAGGLFIWASTAVKLISMSDNPFRELKGLISDSRSLSNFGLDELYATVLQCSGISWDKSDSKARFSAVLALLFFSKVPLSDKNIDGLLGFPPDEPSHLILSRLRCLLSYTPGEPIHLFHASFSDYLQSPERETDPWFIDIPSQKWHVSMRCFAVMKDLLHFNMCNFDTSFIRNDQKPGLEDHIKASIPLHLEYACTYWAQHLVEVGNSSRLLDALSDFSYNRLLFWFEVLSLLKTFRRVGIQALSDAVSWAAYDTTISSFLKDASSLAVIFADPISQSTPHIYVSMLPLMKEDSEVSAHCSKWMTSMIRTERRGAKPKPMWLKVLEGHMAGVWSVCLSPDGKCIISGSEDKTIRIWNFNNGELACNPLGGHTDCVLSVAIARDGLRVASGSKDNTVRIWDMENKALFSAPFEGHTDSVASVAFSPDGKYVASGSSDKTIRLWDTESGKAALGPFEGHTDCIRAVAFSPTGRLIASGSDDKTVRIWDIETGRAASKRFRRHTDGVLCVAFSPDGTRVASGSRDQTIRLWDVVTGEVVSWPFMDHTESVWSVAFSPDGQRLVSSSNDNTIRIWDLTEGVVIRGPFTGHSGGILSVAFSPDGSHIVSGSWDRTIRVWDASSVSKPTAPINEFLDSVLSVAFSPDNSKVAAGSWDRTIRVWDIADEAKSSLLLEGHTDAVWSVAFSPDGSCIISGSRDGTIRVWDSLTGAVVSGPYTGHTDGVFSVSVSPDGTYIASGSNDKTVRIWDMKTGTVVAGPFVGHTNSIWSVAFSPDASRVISGSRDESLILWDSTTGAIILGPIRGHKGTVMSVAFSPDGTCFASCSWDKTIRIWNASTGDMFIRSLEGHTAAVWSIAFSPDGSRIVSGSRDNTIRVWDVLQGQTIFEPFEGHAEGIYSVAFSHDGKHIASGSRDKTIRVWDAEGRSSASDSESSPDKEDYSNWTLAESGWVSSKRGELLLWIPPDLRPTLWRPQNTAILSCAFWTKIDFRGASIGSRWRECFKPS